MGKAAVKHDEAMGTVEVARICRVATRTVAKWIDDGLLKGYVIPGSTFRRVLRSDLEAFAKEYGLPLAKE